MRERGSRRTPRSRERSSNRTSGRGRPASSGQGRPFELAYEARVLDLLVPLDPTLLPRALAREPETGRVMGYVRVLPWEHRVTAMIEDELRPYLDRFG